MYNIICTFIVPCVLLMPSNETHVPVKYLSQESGPHPFDDQGCSFFLVDFRDTYILPSTDGTIKLPVE